MTEGGKLFIMKSTLQLIANKKASLLGKMVATEDKGSYIEFTYI